MRKAFARAIPLAVAVLSLCLCADAVSLMRQTAADQQALALRLGQSQSSLDAMVARQSEDARQALSVTRAALALWVPSADGKVHARLVAEHDVTTPDRPVLLVLEVKNATGGPLTIDQPSYFPDGVRLLRDGKADPLRRARQEHVPSAAGHLSAGRRRTRDRGIEPGPARLARRRGRVRRRVHVRLRTFWPDRLEGPGGSAHPAG
jgi:hypothetical protein